MEDIELEETTLSDARHKSLADSDDDGDCSDTSSIAPDREVTPLTFPPFSQSLGRALFRSNDESMTVKSTNCPKNYRFILGRKYRKTRVPVVEFLNGFDYDVETDLNKTQKSNLVDDGRDYERSLFWFTYRANFPEIQPYGYTSDAGWGCMLRASQMLIAHALRMHFMGRDWLPPKDFNERRSRGSFYNEILTWFADFPAVDCCFSFHNMAACGLSFEKFPGEWYGPGTACHVVRQLCDVHKSYLKRRVENGLYRESKDYKAFRNEMFQVIVTSEGCIFEDVIEKAMAYTEESEENDNPFRSQQENDPFKDPLLCPPSVKPQTSWKSPLLLLVPLRLGLDKLNDIYIPPLIETFSFPQSVGIIGGRPSHAIWFYGVNCDGTTFYGLDPHSLQQSPIRDARLYGAVSVSDSYISSVHTTKPATMNTNKLDPSLALAFYCRSRDDLKSLLDSIRKANKKAPLISIIDVTPDYASDLTMLNEMMGTTELEETNDEDDYVFI